MQFMDSSALSTTQHVWIDELDAVGGGWIWMKRNALRKSTTTRPSEQRHVGVPK
jgi:hypothetical protein